MSETVPKLSVVVNILLGGRYLRRILDALAAQRNAPPLEVVVPFCPGIDDIESPRREYPAVRFVAVDGLPPGASLARPGPAHLIFDRRRAVGLAAARGEIVAMTDDQMAPDPDWCAAIAEAHRASHAAIGGAVENGGPGALHEALCLCDFGRYRLPFPSGEAAYLTDQNVSYKRAALEAIGPLWRESYHEPAVHEALRAAGGTLWLSPKCVVRMDRGRLSWRRQMRERFDWGRFFAGHRARRISRAHRIALAAAGPLIPALIVWRRAREAFRKRYPAARLCALMPAMAAMAVVWACGEVVGYLTARPIVRAGSLSNPPCPSCFETEAAHLQARTRL